MDLLPNLNTRVSESPSVRWISRHNGPLGVELVFPTEPSAGPLVKHALITFPEVLEFKWTEADIELLEDHPNIYEWHLVVIEDSTLIQRMVRTRPSAFKSSDDALGGYPLDDLNHYRISFDEWGTIDIVSYGVEIAVFSSEASFPTFFPGASVELTRLFP